MNTEEFESKELISVYTCEIMLNQLLRTQDDDMHSRASLKKLKKFSDGDCMLSKRHNVEVMY